MPGQRFGYGLGIEVMRWNGLTTFGPRRGRQRIHGRLRLDAGRQARPRHLEQHHGPLRIPRPGEGHHLGPTNRPSYLIGATGFTYYRNDPIDMPADAPPDGVWDQTYNLDWFGETIGTARLLRNGNNAAIDLSGLITGPTRMRLSEYTPNIWHATNGDTLDLSATPPTFASLPLNQPHGTIED